MSVPEKPEQRPSRPPSKQAKKNLILKAISEAQESVTKTANYSAVSQKQTIPVAPRTWTQEELLAEMVQGQGRVPRISSPIKEEEAKGDHIDKSQGTQLRQLLSRLQIDPVMVETLQIHQDYYDVEPMVHADTRSFILKKPKLPEELIVAPNQEMGMKTADALRVSSGRLMQTWDLVQPDKPASPEFIVTLDGVPCTPPTRIHVRSREGHVLLRNESRTPPCSFIGGTCGSPPPTAVTLAKQAAWGPRW